MSSLRLRLLTGTLSWIVVSILVAGWGLDRLFEQHITAQFNVELQTHLDQLTAHLDIDAEGQALLKVPLSDPRFKKPFSGLYWQIDRLAASGRPEQSGTLRSRSLWDQTLHIPDTPHPAGQPIAAHLTDGQGKPLGARILTLRIDGQPLRLTVAADEALLREPIRDFRQMLWLALLLLGGGLALAALLQVLVGLAPLRELQAALARVRRGEAARLSGRFPSELKPLADEFNQVLSQNDAIIERARTQAGNLAHALKTPLTILTNAAAAGETRESELARLVTEQAGLARRQVDTHLARARSAALARHYGNGTPLVPVIDGLVRAVQRIHDGGNVRIEVAPIDPALAFRGEAQDLQEMLGNLLDNACKWARSRIRISADRADGWLHIRIEDDGPGVPHAQRPAILQRGVRADERTPGSGLGLSIVSDLVQLYEGTLTLEDAALGGLRVELTVPAAPATPAP